MSTAGQTPNRFLGLWEGPVDLKASSVINVTYEKGNTFPNGNDDVVIGDAVYLVSPPSNELLARIDWIFDASQAELFYGIAVAGDKGGIYPIKGTGFSAVSGVPGNTVITSKSGDGVRVCIQGRCIARIAPTNDINIGDELKVNADTSSLEFAPPGVKATGTVTCVGVLALDTVTVNGLVYTGVVGAKANNTEFSVDTGNNATATDLADSITNDTRTGTDEPTVDQTAIAATNVVTITASFFGTIGNNVGLSSSNGTRLAVSGATLTGGVDKKIVAIALFSVAQDLGVAKTFYAPVDIQRERSF